MRWGLVLVAFVAVLPAAGAATASSAGNIGSEHCSEYNLSKIVAVVNAGVVDICYIAPTTVPAGGSALILIRETGPDNALGVLFTPVFTIVAGTTVGCTTSSITTTSFSNAATSGSDAYFVVTLTASQCRLVLDFTLTLATTQIIHWQGILNIQAETTAFSNTLSGSITAGLTGAITVTNAGGQSITVSSWPALVAALSGTINVNDNIVNDSTPDGKLTVNQTLVVGDANVSNTLNLNPAPGFFELFGPTLLALLLLWFLPKASVWMVPVGSALGGMIAVMAFTQSMVIIVLMQAASGFMLLAFSLYWLGLRFEEFKPKRRLFE